MAAAVYQCSIGTSPCDEGLCGVSRADSHRRCVRELLPLTDPVCAGPLEQSSCGRECSAVPLWRVVSINAQ